MALGDRESLRVSRAVRDQIEWDRLCLDDLISTDHRARQVWGYVEGCDLAALYDRIRAVDGGAGRAPIDPAILMALWLYATLEGVGSARLLSRLCETDGAYRWICGGVGVNHHTLSDFRSGSGAVLDDLLSRSMAALAATGIVGLDCLAVDGVRVRASAGASSFRRAPRLNELHDLAAKKVALLKAELDADPAAGTKRAQERAMREAKARQARIEAARQAAREIEAERQRDAEKQRRSKPKNTKEPRASTTDAQARIMSMADGGFRPAYNLQFKTDPKSGCVVGLDVTNKASDRAQLMAAIEEIERRYGVKPSRVLADGGYDSKDQIEQAHLAGVEAFIPLPPVKEKPVGAEPDNKAQARAARDKAEEKPGVQAWRERMAKEDSVAIYRQRFACERPHADVRNRGLQRLMVRGLAKVRAVALWHVIAYNFLQIQRLTPQMA
jgi:transposase